MSRSVYSDFILRYAPRVLSDIDRDVQSPTFGSCDRDHWHYKIRDFDSAILQQSGLSVALLYAVPFADNAYYQNENMRRWSEGVLRYWMKIQLRDGSFNEYYPCEHGFPPTAFTLLSSCRSYELLGLQSPDLLAAIEKAAEWLCHSDEALALNQAMTCVAGLYAAYRLLGRETLLQACDRRFTALLEKQSQDGWFTEHGGADIGYSSVFLDMLCEYYRMSGDQRAVGAIEKAVEFLAYFVHPDGTAGGEYASRNTTYFLPFGVEQAAQMGFSSAVALKRVLYGDAERHAQFMDSVDDRYLGHYVLHSFLRALQLENGKQADAGAVSALLPCERKETRYFADGGLLSYHNERYSAYVGLRKGGVTKLFLAGRETFLDCGYRIDCGKRGVAATNWQDPSYLVNYDHGVARIEGRFNLVKLMVATPILHMGLRVVAFLLGSGVRGLLKRKTILVDRHIDVSFQRVIRFEPERVILEDVIRGAVPFELQTASNMSLRLAASGKFFMPSDLLAKQEVVATNAREVRVRTVVDANTQQVDRQVDAV